MKKTLLFILIPMPESAVCLTLVIFNMIVSLY